MKRLFEFVHKTKFVTISMILAGLLIDAIFIWKVHCSPWYELVFHVGETLVIAGLVGLVLELTEFAQYFEDRLSRLMVGEGFLELFSAAKLFSISKTALRHSMKKQITNPESQWEDYYSVVLSHVLPLFTQTYRSNYREVIYMNIIDSGTLGLPPGSKVTQIDTVYEYDVIAASDDKTTKYEIRSSTSLNRIPGLNEADRYYSAELSINGEKKDIKGSLIMALTDEAVHAKFNHEFTVNRLAHVRIHLKEYELVRGPSGLISAKMQDLTRNAMIAFSCEQPLIIDLTAYALGAHKIKPDVKTKNAVILAFPGWMLPGEGFFIDWISDEKTNISQPNEETKGLKGENKP